MVLPEPLNPVYVNDPLPAALNEERDAINALSGEVSKRIELPTGAMFGDLLRWNGNAWETTETRFLEGDGRPEGVVAAPVGSRYIDKVGAQGAVEWVKRSGGESNAGWMCVTGDTGRRNIASLIDKGNGAVTTAYVSRMGPVVEMFLDVTMPSNMGANWTLFTSLAGFSPGHPRYAALQDNREVANTSGTIVTTGGGVTLYGVVGGKRDRYVGTWLTRDPWPSILPGIAG